MITTILFDLDGTLLPMDQDLFLKTYPGGLSRKGASCDYDAARMPRQIMAGTDIEVYPHGSFPELMEFVRSLN